MIIQLLVDDDGIVDLRKGAVVTPPGPGPGPTPPPGPGPTPTPPPENPGDLYYVLPADNQQVKPNTLQPDIYGHVGFGFNVVSFSRSIAASSNPSKQGFVRFAEVPGQITCIRYLKIINNGIVVFDWADIGTAGGFSYFVNYPPGYGLNVAPGRLTCLLKNQMPVGYTQANASCDWAPPDRT